MTLPPLSLDDLTWQELTDAVRSRIPAESAGRWTLHSPLDPGVTLLELQAYVLEQQVFRLDQVPDAVVHAVLRLLGVPGPAPATAAVTVLQVVPSRPGALLRVRAGASFSRDPRPGADFFVERALDVLPLRVTGLAVRAGQEPERDRTADLVAGRPVPLAGPFGAPARVRLRLSVDGSGFPDGGELALLVELERPAGPWNADGPAGDGPADDWSAKADAEAATRAGQGAGAEAEVPAPARLVWSYGPAGAARPLPEGAVTDGTGGLRRSGLVRLRLPGTAGGTEAEVVLDTLSATFGAPPRLRRLTPNAVIAHHARRVELTEDATGETVALLSRRPALPGLVLPLPGGAAGRLIDVERFALREPDGGEREWSAVPDLAFSGPRDRMFTVDRAFGVLRFGDGRTGRIPRPGIQGTGPVLRAAYRLGGGPSGNGGADPVPAATGTATALSAFVSLAGLAANLPDAPPGNWVFTGSPGDLHPADPGCTARAPVRAEGGAEAETPAAARRRAAHALAEVTRAVTAADHEELALGTPGVALARAHALVGARPGHPCRRVPGAVTVLVLPRAPRGAGDADAEDAVPLPRPDPGTLAAVRSRLVAARLIGAAVYVTGPRYRPVRVRVTLPASALPAPCRQVTAQGAARRAIVTAALHRFLDPLVGGDDATGWPFGGTLRPSALLRAAERALAAAGDRTPVQGVGIAVDDAAYEDCADVPLRPGELPGPVDITVCATNRPPGEAAR
ncbi:baseplate J/gp47 family protein [Streptomyces chartreusis]|uniref:baseplate J/gp47 family protein n=1 Tax=Streptomyces chartreusis TaxID=1969 RepID=UPI003D94A768